MADLSSYIYIAANTVTAAGNIVADGNIVANNLTGNIIIASTGNITGANLIAGSSGTGNVYAGNIIVNGQPTTYGVANLTTGVVAIQATVTGTLNSTIGNVTLSNSYSQVVAASSPGTTIFTLPTLQPGTYLITARAKVNGGYSVMGIFTGGSQVANTSAFSWYQASGSVNNGLTGTWVLTVTTPTVYTINAWGGGTVSAGSDGSAVANYIQLNPIFALNALETMSVTGNVSVGGSLSAAQFVGNYSNGTSNVNIPAINGNVNISSGGIANVAVITSTGANIAGTANITGNANVANIGATNGVFTGNISGNTNGFTIGYLNIPQVSAANATLALTDAGKHYYSTTAGNLTLTIPTNANVAFATGTAVSIVVQAAGNILVNAASGVTLYMAGNSTAANRVVGGYGMATLMKVASDTWFINGAGVA